MKIEKLRKNNSKKYFLYGLISVVVLTITVTFITSKANYRMTASIPLTEGKVTASPYDINIVALYLDNVEQDSNTIIPSGYKINEENSYCYKGTNKNNKDSNARVYTDELGNHSFSGISKSSKCILYLEKNPENAKTMSELLNTHYKYKSKRTSENKDFNVPYGETTYGMIFEAEDDDGTTYYFAGNPLDNWVEFGGYYWRIIRINGDGSIRLIYQGTEPNETGVGTQITVEDKNTFTFNDEYNDNKYVGYILENDINIPSNAYMELNSWFASSNIKQGSQYFDKIEQNAGFCGDRTPSTTDIPTLINGLNIGNGSGGIGTVTTYYGAHLRLRPGGNNPTVSSAVVTPILSCSNNSDLYTYLESNKGNKKLANPVGMITADEVACAGMVFGASSIGNFLDTDQHYWTISPFWYNDVGANVFIVYGSGFLQSNSVPNAYGIRPVINIRSDTEFTGEGTKFNPYKVVTS
ncbi:MAG: hypothetical protein NC483_02820, partial [Ruminococcus sp.]|nr:hypothetical protein [Ruminococcus sp.]